MRTSVKSAISTVFAAALRSTMMQSSATAQESPTQPEIPSTPCTVYAQENVPDGYNWACIGQIATFTEDVPRDQKPNVEWVDITNGVRNSADSNVEQPRIPLAPQPSSRARNDDYHSITTSEEIIWGYSGDEQLGATRISSNVVLYNHSGDLSLGFGDRNGVAMDIQFKLRIREDRHLDYDLDIFEYEDSENYNYGIPQRTKTIYEPYWDQGFDQLPYPSDPKRYFWDMHDMYFAAEGKGWISVIGSSQTDRTTCDANTCKFIAGQT